MGRSTKQQNLLAAACRIDNIQPANLGHASPLNLYRRSRDGRQSSRGVARFAEFRASPEFNLTYPSCEQIAPRWRKEQSGAPQGTAGFFVRDHQHTSATLLDQLYVLQR